MRNAAGLSMLKNIDYGMDNDVISDRANELILPIVLRLDVRPMIEAGDHPKDAVLEVAQKLNDGECMELISPFPPVPLIEALRKRGFRVTMQPVEDGIVKTYVDK